MAYTKQQIIEAALLRFKEASKLEEQVLITNPQGNSKNFTIDIPKLEKLFSDFYDEKGKETFRKYASVDAETMRKYFESIK